MNYQLRKWIHPTTKQIRIYVNSNCSDFFMRKVFIINTSNDTVIMIQGNPADSQTRDRIMNNIEEFFNVREFEDYLKLAS